MRIKDDTGSLSAAQENGTPSKLNKPAPIYTCSGVAAVVCLELTDGKLQ